MMRVMCRQPHVGFERGGVRRRRPARSHLSRNTAHAASNERAAVCGVPRTLIIATRSFGARSGSWRVFTREDDAALSLSVLFFSVFSLLTVGSAAAVAFSSNNVF